MCDTNVIIDVLLDMAYKAVGKLLEIAKVCSVTNNDILTAFQTSRIVLLLLAPNLYIVIVLSPETKEILKYVTLESWKVVYVATFQDFFFCIYVNYNADLRF